MDDGPEPMKNMKPTEKNLNSADQFQLNHQSQYENRSKKSADRMKRVHEHNLAYPKLRDEEDKRRSDTKITCQIKKKLTYDPQCTACIKLKQLTKLRKLNIQPRCSPKAPKKKYYRKTKTRMKRKAKYGKSRLKTFKNRTNNKWTYVEIKDKNTETDCDLNTQNDKRDIIELFDNNEKKGSKENSITNSINTLNNPNTSNYSMSSYNSFPYNEHEPMVSKD